jgi:hypothetical protein
MVVFFFGPLIFGVEEFKMFVDRKTGPHEEHVEKNDSDAGQAEAGAHD